MVKSPKVLRQGSHDPLWGIYIHCTRHTCPAQTLSIAGSPGGQGFPIFLLIGFFQVAFDASLARPIPLPQLQPTEATSVRRGLPWFMVSVHGWLLVSTLETLCQDIKTVCCRESFTLENQQATSEARGHIPNDLTSSHKVPHFKGPRIHQ